MIIRPGFEYLETIRLNLLELITDSAVMKLLKSAPNCEHLELTGCIGLTDYFLDKLFCEY